MFPASHFRYISDIFQAHSTTSTTPRICLTWGIRQFSGIMFSDGAPITTETAILASSLATSVVFGFIVRTPPGIFRLTMKTASTALLSSLIFLREGSSILGGALALGSLGDAFLAWDDDSEPAFLCGLSSFLVAHLLYIVEFLEVGSGYARLQSDPRRILLVGILLLAVPALNSKLMPKLEKGLRVPIMVYSAVIVSMCLSALTLENELVVRGALLFATSDCILAIDRFLVAPTSSHRPWMQYAVWILYYTGQYLIAQGLTG